MKKVRDLIRPYLSLVFGVLFFLLFLNNLSAEGEQLAIGIVAVVIACYYLASGVLGVVMGEKMPGGIKTIFGILNVALFPTFMFVFYLLTVIEVHAFMGPSAWVIYPLCMAASLAMVVIYVLSVFIRSHVLPRLVGLFGSIFVLALVATLLFNFEGDENTLADIGLVSLLVYFLFAAILFNSLGKSSAPSEEKPKEE